MEKIKLPRSSYDELCKIIAAYGVRNKPATLDDIAHATGVGRTVVSANNAFLSFLEIIEGGVRKNITDKGSGLALALEHDLPEQIEPAWARIIVDNDFMSKMLQALKIRRGMEVSQFENHIAYSSGEIKSKAVMTGARAVVDILLHSGKLQQDGDKLISDGSASVETPLDRLVSHSSESVNKIVVRPDSVLSDKPNVTLNIELSISAKPNELEGLGKLIKGLLDDIRDAK